MDGAKESGFADATGAPDSDEGVSGFEAVKDGVKVGLDPDGVDVFNGGR